MSSNDYALALQLQKEFDAELASVHDTLPVIHLFSSPTYKIEKYYSQLRDEEQSPVIKRRRVGLSNGNEGAAATADDLNSTQNLVHPEWETIDPTPDIFALFGAFNVKFFNSKLHCVQLEWSKKMYSCAGICYQRRNRMGMAVTIRLSEPLLKLRQRKDLVETLLVKCECPPPPNILNLFIVSLQHEMIHAFLFVLNVREGNGGHGPNFQKMMQNINRTAGTNITVYHTFHDEVNAYKTHVWRCNGICQHRQPFFGYVRRTCNRAPGPNDQWWATHQQTCGGYFKKTAEPEPKKRSAATTKNATTTQNINHPKWGLTDKTNITASTPKREPSVGGGNLTNVHGFKDVAGAGKSQTSVMPATGGRSLGSGDSGGGDKKSVRDVWSTKFVTTAAAKGTENEWETLDDDIAVREPVQPFIDLCDDVDSDEETPLQPPQRMKKLTADERHTQIRAEIMDADDNDSDIELIDDDFDDELVNTSSVLGDTSVVDDIFGADTLMSEFNDVNGAIAGSSKDVPYEIISCPICPERMRRDQLEEHLNGCGGIRVNIEMKPETGATKKKKSTPFQRQSQPALSTRNILLSSGYTEDVVERLLKEQREEDEYNNRILTEMRATSSEPEREANIKRVSCPICQQTVDEDKINEHIDGCLSEDFNE